MNRKRWSLGRILVFLCLAAAAAGIGVWRLESRKAAPARVYHTTVVELDSVNGIPVQKEYIPYDSPRRPGEIREIRYVVIHETDNRSAGADAAAHATFLSTNTAELNSWHYTVDAASIWQSLPDNETSWNAGDGRTVNGGNMNGIAIEMCVNAGSDYEQTLKNTAALTAQLLKNYDLTPADVRLHRDFSGKICPHRLITEGRVPEFMAMVRDDYSKLSIEQSPAAN